MIGLAYILFFSVYGYLSVKAVKYAANWAAENDRSPRVWGFLAGFVMYNLVFWDFIPVYATHAYYCAKLGGLTVYKTPEEWTAENPGVAKMLTPFKTPVFADTNGKQVVFLNQRFSYTIEYKKLSMFHWIEYERIVDRDTRKTLVKRRGITLRMRNLIRDGVEGNVLYEMVNYQVTNHLGEPEVFRDYKIWLTLGACTSDKSILKEQINFNSLESIVGRKK